MQKTPLKLLIFLLLFLPTSALQAETLRIATYNASLSRNGPGLLLNDLIKGENPQIAAVVDILQHVRPDIILINEFDYDADHEAAALFAEALRSGKTPVDYRHIFTSPPNTGRPSGLDLNGDGTTNTPDDALGWGRFPGQYGMLLLSRFPIDSARTFAKLRWIDLPDANLPTNPDGTPFYTPEALAILPLSSKSHWDIRLNVPDLGPMHLLASHPTPPVFDGPENRNGLRNGDEIRFWMHYLDGATFVDDTGNSAPMAQAPFVLLGDLNADPNDGDGDHATIKALLSHPAIQDTAPKAEGGRAAAKTGINPQHRTDPAQDTANWRDKPGPGNLRVDYVLPARGLDVTGSGVFWPEPKSPLSKMLRAGKRATSDHYLVWVDVLLP